MLGLSPSSEPPPSDPLLKIVLVSLLSSRRVDADDKPLLTRIDDPEKRGMDGCALLSVVEPIIGRVVLLGLMEPVWADGREVLFELDGLLCVPSLVASELPPAVAIELVGLPPMAASRLSELEMEGIIVVEVVL